MQQLAPLVKSMSDFFWNNMLLFLLFGTGASFRCAGSVMAWPVCSEGSASTVKRPITRV